MREAVTSCLVLAALFSLNFWGLNDPIAPALVESVVVVVLVAAAHLWVARRARSAGRPKVDLG